MSFIFDYCLPEDLSEKTIVEVGSRLGSVMYFVRRPFSSPLYFFFLNILVSLSNRLHRRLGPHLLQREADHRNRVQREVRRALQLDAQEVRDDGPSADRPR
jgi:hypothetical protein